MRTRGEEVAWAAGLFEGEGCVTETDTFALMLKNTDKSVVDRFDEIVKVGRVYGPYQYDYTDGHARKPFWVWMAYGYDAYDAINLLAQWLSERRLTRAREITGLRFPVKTAI